MAYVLDAEKPEEALKLLIKAAEEDEGYNEIQLPDGRILKILIADEIEHDKRVTIFGTNFHTCLRKCFDSNAASICHLAISILPKEAWANFIKKCLGRELNLEVCEHALHNGRDGRSEAAIIFQIGLGMFDKQEWEVLNKYTFETLKEIGQE